MALLGGGGYASMVAVHERMLMPVPDALTLEEAASLPEVFLTAFDAMILQCELRAGESFLVHAAGSGVGTAAIQIAAAQSCRVFGTAGSAEKLEQAAALGLDVGINYHDQDFAEVVRDETGAGTIRPVVDRVFELDDVSEAHRLHGDERQLRQDRAAGGRLILGSRPSAAQIGLVARTNYSTYSRLTLRRNSLRQYRR